MLNQAGSRDLILSLEELITELKKPGKAFVFCDIVTGHSHSMIVEIVKSDVITTLERQKEWLGDKKRIECHKDQNGLYIGW